MIDVRVAAARALLAVEAREATLAAAIDDIRPQVREVDRGLLLELTTGTLRWRNELDAVIAAAAHRSVRRIEAPVLSVLRLGVYQLRHLDRVPSHAVGDTAVRAVRTLGHASASSFVNGVIRAVIRRGPAIALPARPGAGAHPDAAVNYLTTTLSHPAWLVRRWIERMGFDAAEAWCRFNNTTPDVTARSRGRLSPETLVAELANLGVTASPARYVRDAISLPAGALGQVPAALAAELRVQDEAAQLVARFASATAGERVLDLCAAPGGKTLVLASDMGADADRPAAGLLVASDLRPGRVALLADTARQAGTGARVVRLDAHLALPFPAIFDCVLLDAPCSGLGVLRREPDLKWSRAADDLPALVAAQRRMIRAAADVVRPGGRLVYATCSSEPEENAEVVDDFLAADARFASAEPGSRGVPPEVCDDRGHLVTRPDRHGLEAFFGALLVRRLGT